MTLKTFNKKLRKIIEESGEFITYDRNDKDFGLYLEENQIVVCGEDHTQTFTFVTIKV